MKLTENATPRRLSGPIPAVGVVCLRQDEVLLIRRGRPPRLGEWSLPGGRIEPGERVVDAAMRELREETGVEAEIVALVDVVDGIFHDDGRHFVLIDYVARWTAGEPRAGDDAMEAAFHRAPALDGLGLWQETVRVIHRARRLLNADFLR